MHKLNKYTAVFLLLIFTQGTGMRLWMHYWFHESRAAKTVSMPAADGIKIKCDCLQEATMPLQSAATFELDIPQYQYTPEFAVRGIFFSSVTGIFCSLKGPPGCRFLI